MVEETVRGGIGAVHHPGDELFVDRGRQLLTAALGGEDAVDIVLAGPGVGGVAIAVGSGQHQVIEGWQKGLVAQTVGSQVLLVIPPDQAYGDKEQGPIPANSTLVFVIDILAAY